MPLTQEFHLGKVPFINLKLPQEKLPLPCLLYHSTKSKRKIKNLWLMSLYFYTFLKIYTVTVLLLNLNFIRRSSLSEVYVQVLDENDNNPYFVTDISNLTVMENAKIGTEVATIQARDPDSGDYGKITYLLDRMSSQASILFVMSLT